MIRAYLFSDITRQTNHTYYSLYGTSIGPSIFFYNLKDCQRLAFSLLKPFIYEVELYPESIVGCFIGYIEARKYKIVREVKFIEYLKELNLPQKTTEEFNFILKGLSSDSELSECFNELLRKKILDLTEYERLKFLVILNQTKMKLPLISLEEDYQIHYIKILEFYKIDYDCSKLNYHKSEIEVQKWFGSEEFEIISNQTDSIFSNLFSNRNYISNLILARKITQEQFEVFCEDIATGGNIPILKESAIISGYKIPNKYSFNFLPGLIYQEQDYILYLVRNWISGRTTDSAARYLENNYMIKGFDYSNKEFQKIITAKKIFLKDGFKTIELE